MPEAEAACRVEFAYDEWRAIVVSEGEQVARMWFIGLNPLLNFETPIDAIRENRFNEVAAAAAAASLQEDGHLG